MSDTLIQDEHVVIMTFTVVDAETDEVLDETWSTERYAYIHGKGQMPPGFEEGVEGLTAGETFEFEVPPERAYGAHNSQLVQKVPAERLPEDLTPGMVVQMQVPGISAAPLVFHVERIGADGTAHLDGNHPFAGHALRFMGKIREVRAATEAELESGRVQRDRSEQT